MQLAPQPFLKVGTMEPALQVFSITQSMEPAFAVKKELGMTIMWCDEVASSLSASCRIALRNDSVNQVF